MTRRERVLKALDFENTDRAPMDLDGMASTGISCFAYPALVRFLGLPERPPRVYDTGQMLALPEVDVLDALDTDVVKVQMETTNAYDQPALWHGFDFGGRLPAQVRDPGMFEAQADGTVIQPAHGAKMPPAAFVFDTEHAGQPLVLTEDLPKPDLDALRSQQKQQELTDEQIEVVVGNCRRARESTDRAILFNGPGAGIGIADHGGLAVFPMLCLTEPDFVHELHELRVAHAEKQIRTLLPDIHPYIDVYMCSSDDWGTQNQTIASPQVYRDLFLPYYRRITDTIHGIAPQVKTFLHSCGAVYDIIDLVVESGFDVLNPVQWTAGGHSYQEWKAKAGGRVALWGGGIDTQTTLPLGTVEEVERQVQEVVSHMKEGGGFVFCAIHNILAEIPPEKIFAMYRAAAGVR